MEGRHDGSKDAYGHDNPQDGVRCKVDIDSSEGEPRPRGRVKQPVVASDTTQQQGELCPRGRVNQPVVVASDCNPPTSGRDSPH